MKRIELFMIITGILCFVWLFSWIGSDFGDVRFYIGWAAPIIWFCYFGNFEDEPEVEQVWKKWYELLTGYNW